MICLRKGIDMRCLSCNTLLTDFEATRKSAETEEFLDLCNECYLHVKDDIKAIERPDLMSIEDVLDVDEEL